MHKVTVSERGQVALPAAVLRRMGIRSGDRLLLTDDAQAITLAKGRSQRRLSRDEFWLMMERIWQSGSGKRDPEGDLLRERRRAARW
ncbi:MAG: AbrB/MazE/SpoVT family DNA-binding domain-containing protein [Deltaproteobacteria bacterium]|nr:AbrB/MazE/SpoVT family DNA-binding domain-containing protein [Deltaproteobacteria bacterium]